MTARYHLVVSPGLSPDGRPTRVTVDASTAAVARRRAMARLGYPTRQPSPYTVAVVAVEDPAPRPCACSRATTR